MKLRQPTIETLALVESPLQAKRVAACLRDAGVPTHQYWVEDTRSLSDYLSRQPWDLVLLGLDGKHPTIPACVHRFPETPFVALLERARKPTNTQLLQAGVFDIGYLSHPQHLAFVLKRALETAYLRLENRLVKHHQSDYRRLLGNVLRDSEQAVAYLHDGMHAYANPAYLALTGLADLATARRTPALELVHASAQRSFAVLLRDLQSARTQHRRTQLQLLGNNGRRHRIAADFSRAIYDGEDMVQIMVSRQPQRSARTTSRQRRHQPATGPSATSFDAAPVATPENTVSSAAADRSKDKTGSECPEAQRLPTPTFWPDVVLGDDASGDPVAGSVRPHHTDAGQPGRSRPTAEVASNTIDDNTPGRPAGRHPAPTSPAQAPPQGSSLRLISDNPDAATLRNVPGTTALRELANGKPLHELHLPTAAGYVMTHSDTRSAPHRQATSSLDVVTAGLQLNIRQRPISTFRTDQFERTLLSLAVTPATPDLAQPSLARLPADVPNSAAGLIARVRQQGLLLELDRWTLHNAASQLAKQLRSRSDTRFYVPINIDDQGLQELLPWLARLSDHFRLPSRALNLVLDATGLSDNSCYQPATLAQLATLNIGVGVDGLDADFADDGDGESASDGAAPQSLLHRLQSEDASLPVAERLPIEFAVLDNWLAASLHTRETQQQVTALTDFCHHRGITTVLEVSESWQLATLWQCGVDCFTCTPASADSAAITPTRLAAIETAAPRQRHSGGNSHDDHRRVINLVHSKARPVKARHKPAEQLPAAIPLESVASTAAEPAGQPGNINVGDIASDAAAGPNDSLLDLTLVAGAPAPDLT